MKKTKRFFSTLMAMIFFFAVSSPIYYADNETAAGDGEQVVGTTGSITLNNPQPNTTYELYKIFDMTTQNITTENGSIDSYAYTISEKWSSFFPTTEGTEISLGNAFLVTNAPSTDNNCPILHNGTIKYMNLSDENINNFTRFALKHAVDTPIEPDKECDDIDYENLTVDNKNNKIYKIEKLKLGYYLIYPKGASQYIDNSGTICSLTSSQPEANINIKSEYPTITNVLTDKEGNELTAKENFYRQIGDTVYYKIKGTIPDFTPYYDSQTSKFNYTYGISIACSKGQLLIDGGVTPETLSVTIQIPDITASKVIKHVYGPYTPLDITNTANDFAFEFTNDDIKYIGQPFEITYTTKVLPAAATETKTTNQVSLAYSMDPNPPSDTSDSNIGEYDCTAIEIYTCNIDITKFCGNNIPLENAKFALYKKEGGKNLYYTYVQDKALAPNKPAQMDHIRWYDKTENLGENIMIVTTDSEGKGLFQGLGLGTYYLEETKAPDGFNKLADPIKIDILFDNEEGHAIYKINNAENMPDGVGSPLEETNNHLSVPVKVENKTGSLLPGTGGIGTVIFTITGVALIAAAGLFLLRKKQSEKVSEQ